MTTLALALALALSACGGKRGGEVVEAPPEWATRKGRTRTRMELAKTLIDAGAPEAALDLVSQLRAEGASGPDLDLIQARALRSIGLFDDAGELLTHVVDKHPRNAEARNELGVLYMERKELDAAIGAFGAAVAADPKSAGALNNHGFALLSAGRYDEAVLSLRKSLRLDATQARTRNNLGFALVAAGKEDQAYRVFRAAAAEADARYNLGLGLEFRGDDQDAGKQYTLALQADPFHVKAREGLSRTAEGLPAAAEEKR